ncbi:MAG: AAA family ATPase [Candidatus Micrarchaeaceae archaeon]
MIKTATGEKEVVFGKDTEVLIENIGPIKKAKIELTNGITAIIGPNGSGKTILGTVILSLLQTISGFDLPNVAFNDPSVQIIKDAIKQHISPTSEPGTTIEFNLKSSDFIDLMQKSIEKNFSIILDQNFGVSPRSLISYHKREGKIHYVSNSAELSIALSNKMISVKIKTYRDETMKVKLKFSEDPFSFSTITPEGTLTIQAANPVNLDNLIYGIIPMVSSYFKRKFFGFINVSMLPTERAVAVAIFNGLSSYYAYAFGWTPIQQQQSLLRLDKPLIQRFMGDIFQVSQAQQNKEFPIPGQIPESGISYKISTPFRLEVSEAGRSFPTSLLSSGLSQLIPIDILSKQKNLLIIEEPELNLHLGYQIEIAKYLMDLNKPVIITTHSDFLLVQLGIQSKKRSRELKVYLLNKGVSKPINVSENGDIEAIDTILQALNKQSEMLSNP